MEIILFTIGALFTTFTRTQKSIQEVHVFRYFTRQTSLFMTKLCLGLPSMAQKSEMTNA